MKRTLLAAALLAGGLHSAQAATFKWANDGDANSMDPYTRSETFLLTFTQNFYDPLVRRDKDLKVEAALATKLGAAGPADLALPPAQGREVPGGPALHRRRRGVLLPARGGARQRSSTPTCRR